MVFNSNRIIPLEPLVQSSSDPSEPCPFPVCAKNKIYFQINSKTDHFAILDIKQRRLLPPEDFAVALAMACAVAELPPPVNCK